MKIKLDLHPIYNDSREIEASLLKGIEDAVTKRATELEIIPGKGSGALKKTVVRFLERPEIRAQYHRIEKDGDNWGRLFVHFRWARLQEKKHEPIPEERIDYKCFCCDAAVSTRVDREALDEGPTEVRIEECPSCGSPNKLTFQLKKRGDVSVRAVSGYEE
ncbi:hypothetical protein CCAX7_001090 [Capsulimonas corticalis]|uniref:Uncharacterized protein n=1 Tax=Capsulimonas corticalis TaxID=2219043 RepID=A0A402CRN5_9BACT|nr:Smr/MutS family protein [Capsulimonas corticalis]BDI28058.1 hypothetical protein CCAX7_001090 [Capsulimonas corticalis]